MLDLKRMNLGNASAGCILLMLVALTSAANGQIRIEAHRLGESAEQFFAEAHEGAILRVCATGDFGRVDRSMKKIAEQNCAWLSGVRGRMVSGESGKYRDPTSADETKVTTYAFEKGILLAAEIVFTAPDTINNYVGKSYAQVVDELKAAYGRPTNETTMPYKDDYGVPYEAHQARWLSDSYAIEVVEQPGRHGWTRVNVI
jgi:hypothetical protein